MPQTAVLPQLVVSPVHLVGLTPERATTVEVALPAVAHQVPVGHRLRVVVSSTDQAYANPTRPGPSTTVGLAGDGRADPAPAARPPTGRAADPRRRRAAAAGGRRPSSCSPDRRRAAVWVAGERAAHLRRGARRRAAGRGGPGEDVRRRGRAPSTGSSFRAEPGQVVGLLGPNGAGKTTVMRMLVGSDPARRRARSSCTASRSRGGRGARDGRRLHRGAGLPAAPDRSGRTCDAYWEATGRPAEEAHLDEALADRRSRCGRRPPGARLQPGHAAAARHRPGDARTAARCCCSTSRPTGSIRPRSTPCGPCCATTRRAGGRWWCRVTCSPRSSRPAPTW